MGYFCLTVRIVRVSRNFCSIKIRRFVIIANETTLHRTPNDKEINSYMSPYGRKFTNTFYHTLFVIDICKQIQKRYPPGD